MRRSVKTAPKPGTVSRAATKRAISTVTTQPAYKAPNQAVIAPEGVNQMDSMLDDILRREGGFVNDPVDRGGATNYGITQDTLSRFMGLPASVDDVGNLSADVARRIYKDNYYYGPGINKLPEAIQPFTFDSAVNHGPSRAIRFVQQVCVDYGFNDSLVIDGINGPRTCAAATAAQTSMAHRFLLALIDKRRAFYLRIVEIDPSQSRFLTGWLNRVNEFDQ